MTHRCMRILGGKLISLILRSGPFEGVLFYLIVLLSSAIRVNLGTKETNEGSEKKSNRTSQGRRLAQRTIKREMAADSCPLSL